MTNKYIIIFIVSFFSALQGMRPAFDFSKLPRDLRGEIATFIALGPTIKNAVINLKTFLRTNKQLASLLKDEDFIQYVIKHLATQYKQATEEESMIAAAIALGENTAAKNWLQEEMLSSTA